MSRPKLAKNPMHFESFEALLGLNNMNDGAYNPSYDDLFSVHDLCMDEIQPFPEHPFRVVDDDKMQELVDSIKTYGLMNPGIAIKNPNGGYYIVSGHRRARASMLAGMDSMPFRIIDVDMETARLTQNVGDFLRSEEIEGILGNSDFVYLLNQNAKDQHILADKLGLSEKQLAHVTNSEPGSGLILFDNVVIPFVDKYPTDTKTYRIMNTKPEESVTKEEA